MGKHGSPSPEWVAKILQLRKRLGLNQSKFASRLNYSAMALSRWESGLHEPTAEAYVRMGNLAEQSASNWFWTRAGLKGSDLSRMFPEGPGEPHKSDFPDFEIVTAGSGRKRSTARTRTRLVAIPVLAVRAGTHGAKGDRVLDLDQAEVTEMIAAPAQWCPNPAGTSCVHARGAAMSPVINDGDLLVVDSTQNDANELNGKIIIAWHRATGLTLSRFLMMKGVQLLESESRDYKPVSVGGDRNWRIVAKVLWWIRRSA
jgi:transcriptional regulator with XRE-family HTH domain